MPGESSVLVRLRLLGASTFAAQSRMAARSLAATGTAAEGAAVKMRGVSASMGTALAGIGRFAKHVGLAAGVIALASGKMAMDFQQAMLMIHTQAGASMGEVKRLSGAVLDLAKIEPQSPQQLANALYRLEGAGLRGAKAMHGLKAAADLAAVGNANVEDTAKTLSQVWFSGIKGAGNLRKVVAEMNATVGAGDMRLQQLVDALGTGIMPVAKNAGLRMRDITGALAVFGDETNNVSGWTAQLATALHYLYAPTAKAEGALNSIGLSGSALGKDFRTKNGLLTALTDLRGHLDKLPGGFRGLKAAQTLSQILPGGRGRVMNVMLGQLDRYQAKIKQIGGTTSRFSGAVAKTHETAAFRVKAAWSTIQVAMIQLGQHILPIAASAFEGFAKLVDRAAGAMEGFARSSTGKGVKQFGGTLIHGAPKVAPKASHLGQTHERSLAPPPQMSSWQKAAMQVRQALAPVIDWVKKELPIVGRALLNAGKQLVDALAPAMPFIRNVVLPLLKGIAIGVLGGVVGAFKFLLMILKPMASRLGWLGSKLGFLKGVFVFVGKVIGFVFGGAIMKVLGLLPKVGIVFRLLGAPIRLAGRVVGWFGRGISKLAGWFSRVFTWGTRLGATLPGVWRKISGVVGNFVGGIIHRIESLVGTIRGLAGKFLGAGKHIMGGLWKGIKQVIGSGVGFAADLAKSLANGLVDVMNDLIPNNIHLPNPFPNLDFPNNPIPHLATGGTLRSSGMAVVGERGPELVNLPARSTVYSNRVSRRAGASMGGGGAPITLVANLHLSGKQIHSEVFRVDRQMAELA